jgi:translation elongation factor EF-Tu-like GTPase
MEKVDQMTMYLGLILLVGGILVTGYTLLFREIEIKRVVTLAGLFFFSGVFLMLFERVTLLELPLGKIMVQAKSDAKEIGELRNQVQQQSEYVNDIVEKVRDNAVQVKDLASGMQAQQQSVTALVEDVTATSKRVTTLSGKIESGLVKVRNLQSVDRLKYLKEMREKLEMEIREKRNDRIELHSKGIDIKEMVKIDEKLVYLKNKYQSLDKEVVELEAEINKQ